MMLNKPKFWDKQNTFLSIILSPLSKVFLFIIFIKKKFTKLQRFNLPIVCVGNIYIGGTGKTPISIFLANEISKMGKKTIILRKYYKSHYDEYNLIKNNFKNLSVNRDRVTGLREAEKANYDLAILDDGFQDYRIKKNLNIICFHQNQLIGNGLVLPSGPLRDNLNSLRDADIIIINGSTNKNFEEKILSINKKLKIFYSSYKLINANKFLNKKLLVVAGIGNPENFFQLLEENNLNIKKKLTFPDHYVFKKSEIEKILNEAKSKNYSVIMTEKDYFKIKDYNLKGVNYLKISLEISNFKKLIKKIIDINDKNS